MYRRTLQVVIADDHPVIQSGLEAQFRDDPEIQIVGSIAQFADLLDQLHRSPIDVLVLDLRGMGEAPITMVIQLRRAFPNLAIVVFSSAVDMAPELLQHGALGYVVKDEQLNHLRQAILAAHRGIRYLSPSVAAYIEQRHLLSQETQLRPRELRVLQLLDEHASTEQIATELQIDPRTVQNYISELLHKTGCEGRFQLAGWYRLHIKPALNGKMAHE
jgi:DNA-binding NarL/FixJ family response regulator